MSTSSATLHRLPLDASASHEPLGSKPHVDDLRRDTLLATTAEHLKRLQTTTGDPLVSLVCSTSPDLQVTDLEMARLESLVERARERLELEMSSSEAQSFVLPARDAIAKLRGSRTGHGIAVFSDGKSAQAFRILTKVDDRVVVDPTFATRDLARSLAENPPYRCLVLGQETARLLVGDGDRVHEVTGGLFPMIDRRADERGVDHRVTSLRAHGMHKRDQHLAAAFLRRVATALAAHPSSHLPLFVVVAKSLAGTLRSTTALHPAGVVVGTHEKTSAGRLQSIIRPSIDEHLLALADAAYERLQTASRSRRAAFGVQHVWTAARRSKIETLLVEESFRFPAWTTLGERHLVRAFTTEAPEVIDDAVDEIIEMVQQSGGRVCFVAPGRLGSDGVAAVLSHR